MSGGKHNKTDSRHVEMVIQNDQTNAPEYEYLTRRGFLKWARCYKLTIDQIVTKDTCDSTFDSVNCGLVETELTAWLKRLYQKQGCDASIDRLKKRKADFRLVTLSSSRYVRVMGFPFITAECHTRRYLQMFTLGITSNLV